MTEESEVKNTARVTRSPLKWMVGLLLAIVVVIAGIGAYWAWHQEQYAQSVVNSLTPKQSNSYTIWISQY